MTMLTAPAGATGDHPQFKEVQAQMEPVAGNGVFGGGEVEVEFRHGEISEVEVYAWGLLPDHPHAAHIHYGEEARHECPNLDDDTNDDGHLNTTEGAPAYGPVQVSLTTEGDMSPASVLAIDRYDTATEGTVWYKRSEHIPSDPGIPAAIAAGEAVVVIHGVDYNGDGTYSGDEVSDLDPSLPTEATDPALCGVLKPY
jgi:hypothetical protein